jgi:hypothetical protein
MKKALWAMVLVVGLFFCVSGANAALLGAGELLLEPDILSTQPSGYKYDSSTGELYVWATPAVITQGGVNTPVAAGGSYALRIYVDNLGNFSSGSMGDDLVIIGNGGTLVSGEVTAFGWDNPINGYVVFDFFFTPTGGTLDFGSLGGGTIFVEKGLSFTGSWMADHQGKTLKTDTAPVPVPTTLLLLGSGLMALLGVKRRIQ